MRGDVADVAEEGEVGCVRDDGEDVVGFWGFEMEVRDDLESHVCWGLRRLRRLPVWCSR